MSERRWREAGRPHRGAGCSPGLPWGGHAESSRGARGPPGAADRGPSRAVGGRGPPGRHRGADRAPGAVLSVSQSPEGLKTRGPNHRAVLTAPGHSANALTLLPGRPRATYPTEITKGGTQASAHSRRQRQLSVLRGYQVLELRFCHLIYLLEANAILMPILQKRKLRCKEVE